MYIIIMDIINTICFTKKKKELFRFKKQLSSQSVTQGCMENYIEHNFSVFKVYIIIDFKTIKPNFTLIILWYLTWEMCTE